MLDQTSNSAVEFNERCRDFCQVWLKENRALEDEFARLENLLKSRGRYSYGGQAIYEHIWFNKVISEKGGEFKLNNNWVALIMRFTMMKHPELRDLFKVREVNGLP